MVLERAPAEHSGAAQSACIFNEKLLALRTGLGSGYTRDKLFESGPAIRHIQTNKGDLRTFEKYIGDRRFARAF